MYTVYLKSYLDIYFVSLVFYWNNYLQYRSVTSLRADLYFSFLLGLPEIRLDCYVREGVCSLFFILVHRKSGYINT